MTARTKPTSQTSTEKDTRAARMMPSSSARSSSSSG
jgi:hypothetical protein